MNMFALIDRAIFLRRKMLININISRYRRI